MKPLLKVLHCYHYPLIKRLGGPSTYLYNLRQLSNKSVSDVEYQFSFNQKFSSGTSKVTNLRKANTLKDFFKKHFEILYKNARIAKFLYSFERREKFVSNVEGYDILHFHDAYDLVSHADIIVGGNTTIVLTSHCPKARYMEFIEEDIGLRPGQVYRFLRTRLAALEEKAYQLANFVVTPCEEALEPYYHSWPNFEKIIAKKKIFYCPTGIEPAVFNADSAKKIIQKNQSLVGKYIICFAGRHIEVKGYDLLKDFCMRLLNEFGDVAVVVLGKQGAIPSPKHERWIEIGWTDTPHDYIAASNLFVLPNRETFFDLILLEVMSIGRQMLLSRTGGNKFFEKNFETTGIRYFDLNSYESFKLGFDYFYASWKRSEAEKQQTASAELIEIFDNHFLTSMMISRLDMIYKQICSKKL
jgi:glycosyltransferase involved in cell wall biosynthesis